MAGTYDLNVSGAKAQTIVITPVNGKDGAPLGPAGDGPDGKAQYKTCTQQAGPGLPGNEGTTAPTAQGGANGGDAVTATITCSEYSGGKLALLNHGGDGADGNSGGAGGKGSAGGKAGNQPTGCKQLIYGGIGGAAGGGGNAGGAGKGGNASDVVVISGSGFSSPPVTADSAGGNPGKVGTPGNAGNPGQGGLNSDGTQNSSGAQGGGGASGTAGAGGYGGSFKAYTDTKKPSTYLKISVQSHLGT
jgi:hypothetical protein